VLEIGTGSGYQAAVLGELCDSVFTIEIVDVLGKRSSQLLNDLGYDNVRVMIGDGYKGWPMHAPFDAIIVTCSPTQIPMPLQQQLAEGGNAMPKSWFCWRSEMVNCDRITLCLFGLCRWWIRRERRIDDLLRLWPKGCKRKILRSSFVNLSKRFCE